MHKLHISAPAKMLSILIERSAPLPNGQCGWTATFFGGPKFDFLSSGRPIPLPYAAQKSGHYVTTEIGKRFPGALVLCNDIQDIDVENHKDGVIVL